MRTINNSTGTTESKANSPEPHPKDGHIRIPNELVDKLAQLQASGAEWQIIFATWRRTLGWQHSGEWRNEPYPISLGDLARATGLNRRHIAREVKDLVQRHILKRTPGDRKHLLCFNLDYNTWVVTKQSLVAEQSLGSGQTVTSTSGQTATSLVAKQSLSLGTNQACLKKPKETINKHAKETGVVSTPPIKTGNKLKHYQVDAGIFIDLVEEREDTKIINRGKATKAIRSILSKYPETTPQKLYQCFAWLSDNDSFLHNKEPPAIISFMPDKFPAWLAGKLQWMGDEVYGRQSGKGVGPKPRQERRRTLTYTMCSEEDPDKYIKGRYGHIVRRK